MHIPILILFIQLILADSSNSEQFVRGYNCDQPMTADGDPYLGASYRLELWKRQDGSETFYLFSTVVNPTVNPKPKKIATFIVDKNDAKLRTFKNINGKKSFIRPDDNSKSPNQVITIEDSTNSTTQQCR